MSNLISYKKEELNSMNLKELQAVAKEFKAQGLIEKCSGLKKAALLAALLDAIPMKTEEVVEEAKKEFRGIRKNVGVTRKTTNHHYIEDCQRGAMHGLYEDENKNACLLVVRRFEIREDKYTGEITKEMSYQTIGKSPAILAFGRIHQEPLKLIVGKENEATGELEKKKKVTVGPDKDYRLVDDVAILNFKNNEGLYDKFRGLHGFIDINEGIDYFPAITSPSMNKHSNILYSVHDSDMQYKIVDDLSGGVFSKQVAKLKAKAKAEGRKVSYDEIATLATRLCLCATTPSLWPKAGITRNVFYFNGSIDSEDEQLSVKIKEIDNHFRDGYKILSDSFAAAMFEEIYRYITCKQARYMSWQIRVRGAAGKGHARAYDANQRLKEIQQLLEIDANKCFCWIDGEKVNLKELDEDGLKEVAAKVDIIGDKDTFKLFDFELLNSGGFLEVGIVNMSNKTEGRMGAQIAFKLQDDEEDAIKLFKAYTRKQLVKSDNLDRKLVFDKKELKLANYAYASCMAINPEIAAVDKLLNNFRLKQIDTAMLPKIANLKFDINAMYLRMVPEDHLLNDRKEVLKAKMVRYTMPNGVVKKVKCTEAYSPAFEKEYYDMKAKLDANTKMTEKEKATVLKNMRVVTGIKSPSQGRKEYELFYMVLSSEIKHRGVTAEYEQFIKETPFNCLILAQDNVMKRQLAGSDFDGDDMTIIMPEFTEHEGKIITGLILNGEIINDYTSLLVRDRVRDNNVGVAALIIYHDDKPARYGEEAKEEENNKEWLVVDTSDFF